MMDREFNILQDAFRRLIRRNARSNTQKMIMKTHPADLAALFRPFTEMEREMVFKLISDRTYKAEFLTELDRAILVEILEDMAPKDIAELLNEMAPDDQADLLAHIPDDLGKEVLGLMSSADSEDLEELMMYDPDTAGGIMVPLPFKMNEHNTVQETIDAIHEQKDVEMVFYIYIVDNDDRLTGVISLRQLLMISPKTILKNTMITKLVTVQPETDQEEVARIISRYNFLALPVVDRDNKLLGIITVDDIIDVIREEATEDILKMAGVGEELVETKSIVRSIRIRLPWLLASFLGGIVAIFILGGFQESLQTVAPLAFFIPIIMGMGGNVGIQSSTIVVRGIATGRVNVRHLWIVVSKEMAIGLILGLLYGLLLGTFVQFQFGREALALSVAIGVVSSMSMAALMGAFMPMMFARMNIDPAVATGPFITSFVDILSVSIYFQVATILLGI